MGKTIVAALLAVALGVATALYVDAHRRGRGEFGDSDWAQLDNGLRFTVRPVAGAKNVAVLVSFSIGSSNDPEDRVGLAHLTEHVYVTSAAGAAGARTAEDLERNYPGRFSATTHTEATNFLTIVAAGELEAELTDAAARMSDLRIEQTDLDRERPRVLEQIAAGDTPAARTLRIAEQHLGLPPGVTAGVGVPADVERISLADLRDRAARYYKPANARLVVAGDVDTVRGTALVERLFARVPPGEAAPPAEEPRPASPGVFEIPPSPDVAAAPDRIRDVCILSPPQFGDPMERAALGLMEFRAIANLRAPPSVMILPFELPNRRAGRALTSWRSTLSVEGFAADANALIARVTKEPPSADELEKFRTKIARSLKQVGMGPGDEGKPVADGRLAMTALLVARADAAPDEDNSADHCLDAISALTKDDLDRAAAKWFGPEGRVVVATWRIPEPAPPPKTDTKAPRSDLLGGFDVVLTWDEATSTLHRRIGDAESASDEDLENAIRREHDVWVKRGKPGAPVTIVGGPRIPWSDIGRVLAIVKRCGIDHIEFDMGAPPAERK